MWWCSLFPVAQMLGSSATNVMLDGHRRLVIRPDGSSVTLAGRMKRWNELEDGLESTPVSPLLHPVLVPTACLKIETLLPGGENCVPLLENTLTLGCTYYSWYAGVRW